MNRPSRKLALACLSLSCALSAQPSFPQGEPLREYDWIIDIETEELKEYLNYPGSTMRPIVKAVVTLSETEASEPGAQPKKGIKYEDLFYKQCDPIGLRRYRTFDVRPGDGVAIRLKHKRSPVSAEVCAGANAIVRLLLDAYMNGNPVISVLVPGASFAQVVQELHRQNFYPAGEASPDEPVYASIILHLQSDPPGSTQTMHYAGRTTD